MYRFVGAALAAQGFTTVIPDYRVYPQVGFPTFIENAALAYVWAQKHLNAEGQNSAICAHGPFRRRSYRRASGGRSTLSGRCAAPRRRRRSGRALCLRSDHLAAHPRHFPRGGGKSGFGASRDARFPQRRRRMFFARGAEDDVVAGFNADDMTARLERKGRAGRKPPLSRPRPRRAGAGPVAPFPLARAGAGRQHRLYRSGVEAAPHHGASVIERKGFGSLSC